MKKHDVILYSAIAICILGIIITFCSESIPCIIITTLIAVGYGVYAIYDQKNIESKLEDQMETRVPAKTDIEKDNEDK